MYAIEDQFMFGTSIFPIPSPLKKKQRLSLSFDCVLSGFSLDSLIFSVRMEIRELVSIKHEIYVWHEYLKSKDAVLLQLTEPHYMGMMDD